MNGQAEIVVRTHALNKRFGDFTAVNDVSFEIFSGEVVGYLGPNGSGKTTTIRMLLGLLLPSSGTAQVLGYDCVRESEAIRQRVGYLSQKFSLYNDLTVEENLVFYAGVYGMSSRARVDEVIEQIGLVNQRNMLAGRLSTGWRQRLALATAIVHRPKLLFLDEPTSGVDPTTRRAFWELIYQLVGEGITALVTTHYMDEAEYCSRVGIMRDGRLLAIDAPSALKTRYLQGVVWDIAAQPLLPVLEALEKQPGVQRARLAGDHLSAIASEGFGRREIEQVVRAVGGELVSLRRIEPSLEDVFLALACENGLE